MNILTELDIETLKLCIETISLKLKKDIKSKEEFELENGGKCTLYHLGKTNKTIRIDIKLE